MDREPMTGQDLDLIFRDAHTANGWDGQPVSDDLLRRIYDVMKFGPTSANSSPLRVVFIKTKEAKEKLRPCLDASNVDKTMAAPVTALFGYDMQFHNHFPFLFPHTYAKAWFDGNEPLIKESAFRNGTLQAAYFMIAARALGLDCGPMSGFSKEKADAAFFGGTSFKSNFLCNLGYADETKNRPRGPRFTFEDVCSIA